MKIVTLGEFESLVSGRVAAVARGGQLVGNSSGDYKVPTPITETVAPLGPNARAMIEERRNCTHQFGGVGVCVRCGASAYRQPSPRPTVLNLIADIAAGIRVLRTYGVEITEAQVMERANNIVAGIVGNYNVTGMGE